MKWGATTDVKIGSNLQVVYVGPCCERCYWVGTFLLGYATWAKFYQVWCGDEKWQIAVTFIIQHCPHTNAPLPPAFSPAEVSTSSTWKVCQVVKLKGYPESVLKAKLDISRLTAASTKAVCEIQLPSLLNPDVRERFFCFSEDQGKPCEGGVDIIVEGGWMLDRKEIKLLPTENLCANHASAMVGHSCSSEDAFTGAKAALRQENTPTIDDYCRQYNEGRALAMRRAKSSDFKVGGLTGAASGELVVCPSVSATEAGDNEASATQGAMESEAALQVDLSDAHYKPGLTRSKSTHALTSPAKSECAASDVGADDQSCSADEADDDCTGGQLANREITQ